MDVIKHVTDWYKQYAQCKDVVPDVNIVQDNFIEIESCQIRFIDEEMSNRPTQILVVQSCADDMWMIVPFSPVQMAAFESEYDPKIDGCNALQLWNVRYIPYDILKTNTYYVDDILADVVCDIRRLFADPKNIPDDVKPKLGPNVLDTEFDIVLSSALMSYRDVEKKNLNKLDNLT